MFETLRRWKRKFASSRPRLPKERRLGIEGLESRALLAAAGVPSDVLVHGRGSNPVSASSSGGRTVIVWTETPNSSTVRLHARIYDAANKPVGAGFIVATLKTGDGNADVAMDSAGNFVVVWQQRTVGVTGNDILAQRYNAAGAKVGAQIRVAATFRGETNPSVAMLDNRGLATNGSFVVAYESRNDSNENHGNDVVLKHFSAAGRLTKSENAAATSAKEYDPAVAMNRHGQLALAYAVDSDSFAPAFVASGSADVFLRRYAADGQLSGSQQITVNGNQVFSRGADVGIDGRGNIVVAYVTTDDNFPHGSTGLGRSTISVATVSRAGVLLGTTVVDTAAADNEADYFSSPVVAMNAATGSFLVGYTETFISESIFSRANLFGFTFQGNAIAGLPPLSDSDDRGISVSINPSDGRYLVAYVQKSTGRLVGKFRQLA